MGVTLTRVQSLSKIGQIGRHAAPNPCSFCCGLWTILGWESIQFLHTSVAAVLSDVRAELGNVDKGKVLKAAAGPASLMMLGFQGHGSQFPHSLSWANGQALSLLWRYINSD